MCHENLVNPKGSKVMMVFYLTQAVSMSQAVSMCILPSLWAGKALSPRLAFLPTMML
jgi:hypothetical protein